MTSDDGPNMLDLAAYADRDEALALVAHGCPAEYSAVAGKHMVGGKPLVWEGYVLFGSFVSRMRGLHEGVLREIEANNPHAALPLLRAWVEAVTLALYINREPGYAEYLIHGPRDGRRAKKTFGAMFHAVREDAKQLELVYRELSDYSHFGSLGVWNAHAADQEEDGRITWTDVPRWKTEDEFRAACALASELAVAGLLALDRLGDVLLPPEPE